MRRLARWACVFVAMLIAACADGVTFDQVSATLPPAAPDQARIFVYRGFEPYQSLSWVPVFFNGSEVGAVGPGKVLMRDVAPGTYTIAAKSQGLWPDQNKSVIVAAGQTVYAKVESFRGLDPAASGPVPIVTFVVVLQDSETGRREIGKLWYSGERTKDPAAAG